MTGMQQLARLTTLYPDMKLTILRDQAPVDSIRIRLQCMNRVIQMLVPLYDPQMPHFDLLDLTIHSMCRDMELSIQKEQNEPATARTEA